MEIGAGITGSPGRIVARERSQWVAWITRASAAMLLLAAPGNGRADEFARGLELFRQNQVSEALPHLEKAAARRGAGAEIHAWLADAYRRLGRRAAADSSARLALELAPCMAQAHETLADNFNDQYGEYERANADSSWAHSLQAVECDSTDGNAWMSLWIEAMRRGDGARERRAYRILVSEGFFTRPVMSFNRWLLARLPERSLLLVNGDLDTYPALALQALEGFRSDVAVVNVSLLELDWYRRLVRDRYEVPMPFAAPELDQLAAEYDASGNLVGASMQLERGWLQMLRVGTLGRPLVYSVSLPLEEHLDSTSLVILEGAGYRALTGPVGSAADTAKIRVSLTELSPRDFAGPWVSPRDRSPVRRANSDLLVSNILAAAIGYLRGCGPDDLGPALAMLDWAVDFGRRAEAPARVRTLLEQYRHELASRAGR